METAHVPVSRQRSRSVPVPPSPARQERARHHWDWVTIGLLGIIAVFVAAAFWPAVHASFVDLDDGVYVFMNPHVLEGLTPRSVAWALTTHDNGFYLPATRLSLLLDGTISRLLGDDVDGSNPAAHLPDAMVYHVTNILLHAAAAWMLFLFLHRATRERWASFAVALLWAVHPLRVESVAWVTERKDEIAGVFGFLAMYLYVAARRAVGVGARRRFWASCGALVLSMWGKPMFSMMPILLLLVDYWPLARIHSGDDLRRAVLEKWPMWLVVLLGAAGASVTSRVNTGLPISMWEKSANAMLSYIRYIVMQVDFVRLAPFYPYVGSPWPQVCGVIGLLAAVTAVVTWQRRRWPWLMWGWVWYLVGSLPTIGFVQTFTAAFCDRFSYLGSVGLIVMVAFAAFRWRRAKAVPIAATLALAVVLAAFSYRQTLYWHDTITLFERARDITPPSKELHWSLGHGYLRAQRLDDTEREYLATVAADPHDDQAYLALAHVYLLRNRTDLALPEARKAAELSPEKFEACRFYGFLLMQAGQYDGAAAQLEKAAAKRPDDIEVRAALQTVQMKSPTNTQ